MSEKGEEECVVVKVGEIEDVEEGEISDSCSVEEISEKDFSKGDDNAVGVDVDEMKKKDKEVVAAGTNSTTSSDPNTTRVWTMQDLYKYQNNYHQSSNYKISNGYASGLYNIAWAQAVNNKPFDQYLISNFRKTTTTDNSNVNSLSSDDDDDNVDKNKNKNSGADVTRNNVAKEGTKVVIEVGDDDDDVEMEKAGMMEEGELEEGEIDLDSEAAALNNNHLVANNLDSGDVNCDNELEKQLSLISQDLQMLSLNDGDK